MNLNVNVNGKSAFVTPKGVKLGSKGKVLPAGAVLGMLNKGDARAMRKALRNAGHADKAAASRMSM